MGVQKYIAISSKLLKSEILFPFDLYIKINTKFIKYIPNGEAIEEEKLSRIRNYENRSSNPLDRLFVPAEQEHFYNDFIDKYINATTNSQPPLEADEQAQRIQDIANNAVEVIFSDPESKMAFELCQKAATGLRKVVTQNPGALKIIFERKGQRVDSLVDHCKRVSALSLKVAFSLGMRGAELDSIGAAGLLHDIGLNLLPLGEIDILFKRRPERWGGDDSRLYRKHVTDGIELISKKSFVNKEIIDLIKNHEENLSGKGYPEGKKQLKLSWQALSLCNVYDKELFYGSNPKQALKKIIDEEAKNYDAKLLLKLKEVVQTEDL